MKKMYKDKKRNVNHVEFDTAEREIREGSASLVAEAGTTGCSGSDCRLYGGRTFVRIERKEGDFCFIPLVEDGICVGIVMAGCGDGALEALAESLFFCEGMLNKKRFV